MNLDYCYSNSTTGTVVDDRLIVKGSDIATISNNYSYSTVGISLSDYYSDVITKIEAESMDTTKLREMLDKLQEEEEKKKQAEFARIQAHNAVLRDMVEDVKFSGPCTIVFWNDGTKTMVRCHEKDHMDQEKGILACMAKKLYDNTNIFNEVLREYAEVEDETHVHGSTVQEQMGNVNKIVEEQQAAIDELRAVINDLEESLAISLRLNSEKDNTIEELRRALESFKIGAWKDDRK